jgi:hypothetical protein
MAQGLTKRQRYWLQHIERAAEQGGTLKAYAEARRISLGALYNAKSKLLKAGVLESQLVEPVSTGLVAVRIEPPVQARSVLRLRHRSGWELECERWPDPRWLLALVHGEHDDAAP